MATFFFRSIRSAYLHVSSAKMTKAWASFFWQSEGHDNEKLEIYTHRRGAISTGSADVRNVHTWTRFNGETIHLAWQQRQSFELAGNQP
jgi:hypothetical protein